MSISELASLRHPPEEVVAFVKRLTRDFEKRPGSERRAQPRKAITVPVVVQRLDDEFQPVGETFSALTKDISGGGVGILHSEPVTTGYLQIQFSTSEHEQMVLLSCIRHCTPCGQAYHIGGRFVVDWSAHHTQR